MPERTDNERIASIASVAVIEFLNDRKGFHVSDLDGAIQAEFIVDLNESIRTAIDAAMDREEQDAKE